MNEPTRGALRYLALFGALFLSACDFSAGVYRNYSVEEMPAPRCVEETLAQAPGVHDVTHSVARYEHEFRFHAEGARIELAIGPGGTGARYYQSSMRFNSVPTREEVQSARSVMTRVDQALEASCHLKGLKLVEEHCPQGPGRGDKCP